MGHYSDHLGRQALSFLKHLMIKQGEDLCNYPEYFEDDFFTLMKNYSSLNGYMLSYYEEGKRKLKDEDRKDTV